MLKRYFVFMFIMLSLTGCIHAPKKMPLPAVAHGVSVPQIRTLPAFTRVDVRGLINVNLHTGDSASRVMLRGDPRDLTDLKTRVVNGTLYVTLGKGYPHYSQVVVDVYSRYLVGFSYHGRGTVTGTNLNSNGLDLLIDNKGSTSLQGHLVLRKLNVVHSGSTQLIGVSGRDLQATISGTAKVQVVGVVDAASFQVKDHGWLSMYWVKTSSLMVRGKDSGFIQLAGIVDRLDVELWNQAHYNGRYLRAEQAFVKTHNYSLAEISVLKHQHTLASDASNIYFYNIPETSADFMAFSGSVLDMREWL